MAAGSAAPYQAVVETASSRASTIGVRVRKNWLTTLLVWAAKSCGDMSCSRLIFSAAGTMTYFSSRLRVCLLSMPFWVRSCLRMVCRLESCSADPPPVCRLAWVAWNNATLSDMLALVVRMPQTMSFSRRTPAEPNWNGRRVKAPISSSSSNWRLKLTLCHRWQGPNSRPGR